VNAAATSALGTSRTNSDWILAGLMMLGVYVRVEPAPFDVAAVAVSGYLLVTRRLRMSGVTLLPIALMLLFGFANLLSLVMVPNLPEVYGFVAVTFYLMLLWFVTVGAQGQRGVHTTDAMLWGYSLLAGVAGAAGVAGYLGFPGLREVAAPEGRLLGFFKDPNVFGAYLVPAALYGASLLIGRRTRHRLVWMAIILSCCGAILLTFSRGAWANLIVAGMVFAALFTFADGLSRAWWRAMIVVPILLTLIAAVAYQMLTFPAVSDMFDVRFGMQSYDTLRFSNQREVFEAALEHPLGLGPGSTGRMFVLAAHNVYIWALMETGILGFVSLIGMMLISAARAIWLAVAARDPDHRLLFGILAATLCAIYGEAAIIDVIHWRHFWLLLALAWCPAPVLRPQRR
jgi:O-antigen ligase